MWRFLRDVLMIVVSSVLVNVVLTGWDLWHFEVRMPEQLPATPALARPLPTPHPPMPTSTPAPQTQTQTLIVYIFNLAPTRVWFSKDDALAYREAMLDGEPTRPYISADKSRTVRGGRFLVLKQEDGLIMVKQEDGDVVGWMQ